MSNSIPARWLKYRPIGQQISGTRFIAFKVPLRKHINEHVEEHLRLAPESLLESVPNLGLIIDLTNTNRYYSPNDFSAKNVRHQKLMIPGRMTPSAELSSRFCSYVSDFLESNKDNDKLIGVHCTHGVNRTGYMICYYMINILKMQPDEAIQAFAAARGHQIERSNYIQSLKNFGREQPIVNWRQQAAEYRNNNYDAFAANGQYGQSNTAYKIGNRNHQYNSYTRNYDSNYNDRYTRNYGNTNGNNQDRNSRNNQDRNNSNYGRNNRNNSNSEEGYSRKYGHNNYANRYTNNYGNNNSNSNERYRSNYGNNSNNNSSDRYTNNHGNWNNNSNNNRNNNRNNN